MLSERVSIVFADLYQALDFFDYCKDRWDFNIIGDEEQCIVSLPSLEIFKMNTRLKNKLRSYYPEPRIIYNRVQAELCPYSIVLVDSNVSEQIYLDDICNGEIIDRPEAIIFKLGRAPSEMSFFMDEKEHDIGYCSTTLGLRRDFSTGYSIVNNNGTPLRGIIKNLQRLGVDI